MQDIFLGQKIEEYVTEKHIGDGVFGYVYYAYRSDINDSRAVKFIKKEDLRQGWENEITKVISLRTTPGVVRYHSHNFIIIKNNEYLYITWDYIPGESLQQLFNKKEITLSMLIDVLEKVLEILHACKQVNIQHADLHCGNILVEESNPLNLNPEQRKIWITDFGYANADGKIEILDDLKGLNTIIQQCLKIIDFHSLDGRSKHLYTILKNEMPRLLLESNATMGSYVNDPRNILKKWRELRNTSRVNNITSKNIGDYLAAEHIGERYDEWKTLFVPKFLAMDELLSKNICVLTGLRGCGKTMIFRRLTALYDLRLGPSGVQGSDGFIGFYLNARHIAEAFPWLPEKHENNARNQVINFFHLSWCLEIIDWLKEKVHKMPDIELFWLSGFFKKYYPNHFNTTEYKDNILDHISDLLNSELEKSRLQSRYKSDNWVLAELAFLERFVKEISNNINLAEKPFYFFLDDYSTPMVNTTTQRILNPVIFRRSSIVFFKIATESVESYEPVGLNGKILEEEDDYILIDFGTQAILRNKSDIKDILSSIFSPRISRHPAFAGKNLGLENILGKTRLNNTELAQVIRGEPVEKDGKIISKEIYHGTEVFYSMWSSDIRELISLFAEMVSIEKLERIEKLNEPIIKEETQDKVLREAGGKFLNLIEAATNLSNTYYVMTEDAKSYGGHLVEITRAFQEIASFDLKNKNSKNVNKNPPKQSRRIEITGITKDIEGNTKDYYKGLIRYGLFIRDNRGKSVRGKVVPRLFLRGLLIPYFRLTFSKRDSITFSWEDFCDFLDYPLNYKQKYIKKHTEQQDLCDQLLVSEHDKEQMSLWDD